MTAEARVIEFIFRRVEEYLISGKPQEKRRAARALIRLIGIAPERAREVLAIALASDDPAVNDAALDELSYQGQLDSVLPRGDGEAAWLLNLPVPCRERERKRLLSIIECASLYQRAAAAFRLATSGQQEDISIAMQCLEEVVKEEEGLAYVLTALLQSEAAKRLSDEVLERLLAAMARKSSEYLYYSQIAAMAAERGFVSVVECLKNHPDPDARIAAAQVGDTLSSEQAVAMLLHILYDANNKVAEAAARKLLHSYSDSIPISAVKKAVTVLLNEIGNEEYPDMVLPVRLLTNALRRVSRDDALALLKGFARALFAANRIKAVPVAGAIQDWETLKVLSHDEHSGVRYAVASALSAVHPQAEEATNLLLVLVEDRNPVVCRMAFEALLLSDEIPPSVMSALAAVLFD